jgi:hypothetical protein
MKGEFSRICGELRLTETLLHRRQEKIVLGSMLRSQFSAIFGNFLRKKSEFFSKTNVMIKILDNLALL